VLARPLASATAILLGLLAGGLLLIRVVLVPFWRGMPPAEFRTWFAAHAGRLRRVMMPLAAGSAAAASARAAVDVATGEGVRPSSAVAAGAAVGVIAVTVAVNGPPTAGSSRAGSETSRPWRSSGAGCAGTT
jgi:hypothetical protein